ncbi:MAG: hypothetical protein ABJC10_01295 [Acidobacteriota bacterium]
MNQRERETQFVLCIRNEDCDDLETRKIYRLGPDKSAIADGYVRLIDESGEDYLYPGDYFVATELSQTAQKALLSAA